jgi:NPCBM-associated, NEW3 domain of alpha-galactosidase
MQGSTLSGRIVYLPNGGDLGSAFFGFFSRDSIILADLVPGAAVDIGPNSSGKVLDAGIVARAEGDYVPYAKGASIYLDLRVSFTRVEAPPFNFGPKDAPVLQPGGLATLPLNEYHDKVAQVFASNRTLVLGAAGSQDRTTNPGKTVLFNLTLANNGLDPITVDLELTGTHLAWTTLLTPKLAQVDLDGGSSTTVQVAVRVPTDADKGDTADLVLSATSADDLNVRSLARLYATVDTVKQWPDDAATVALIEGLNAHKKSPGIEVPLLVLGLAALALARRRLL